MNVSNRPFVISLVVVFSAMHSRIRLLDFPRRCDGGGITCRSSDLLSVSTVIMGGGINSGERYIVSFFMFDLTKE
jgi:hypothetical protein